MKDRVPLLYLKTGGDHLYAARALADKIPIDGYHLMNGVLKPWGTVLFILLPLLMDLTLWSISRLTSRYLAEHNRETRTVRIVILHYLMARAVSDALDLLGKDRPGEVV